MQKIFLKNFNERPSALYVHIPFCVKKCLFCSFAVSVGQMHKMDEYLRALEQESHMYKGAHLKTIYFGGGTPSFLSEIQIKNCCDAIRNNFKVADDAEWSMEINPEDVNAGKAATIKALGFGRVSLGVQSFNDAYLKFLGRAHDRAQALRAFEILRGAGFDNINIDLMYGFPGQKREELQADLEQAAALQSEHVSIYTLTIEPNSRFYARQMKLDEDEKLGDDYVFVTEFLEQQGLKQYEVSNFARPGFQSRHNMVYWQGGDYIGLGMGAHSLVGNRRFWNVATLKDYLAKVPAGNAVGGGEDLTLQTRLSERLIFGLRMNEGIDLAALEKEVGIALPQESKARIDEFAAAGLLSKTDGHIRTTMQGRLVLDEIASRLIV